MEFFSLKDNSSNFVTLGPRKPGSTLLLDFMYVTNAMLAFPQPHPDSVLGCINRNLEHSTLNGFVKKSNKHQEFLLVYFFLVVFTEDMGRRNTVGGLSRSGSPILCNIECGRA